jgi:hypothetical protein
MANQENTAAMLLSQLREVVEERTGFWGLTEIDTRTKEAVKWIENHEAGLGSLERIFEDGWRGDGSTQGDQAGGIAIELGEARVNDFRVAVLH